MPFICECADTDCTDIVRLTLHQYENVRRHPRRLFAVPGHEPVAVEAGAGVLVEKAADYVLVDKIGAAGDVAESDHEDHLP